MSIKYSTFVAASIALAAPAVAADLAVTPLPPPAPEVSMFDFAVGAKLMSDYNFRGISQSDRGPAVSAYAEGQYNFSDWLQFYVAVGGASVKLPTDPSAEINIYGGVRPTFGDLAFDFGVMRYVYPKEILGVDSDFTEFYAKAAYKFSDMFTIGANLYYANDWLNLGPSGAYASATAKVSLPHDFAISGEVGRYFLGSTTGVNFPDYTYWNAGVSYTYKALTLDVRYHDTDLSKSDCLFLTGDPRGMRTRWCSAAVIASLSFDITGAGLK